MSPLVANCRSQAEPCLEEEGWGSGRGNVASSLGVSTTTTSRWPQTGLINEETEGALPLPHPPSSGAAGRGPCCMGKFTLNENTQVTWSGSVGIHGQEGSK